MQSSIDAATFVVGTLVLFGLAAIGAATVGVLSYLGILTIRTQIEAVEEADDLIRSELERRKLEDLAK